MKITMFLITLFMFSVGANAKTEPTNNVLKTYNDYKNSSAHGPNSAQFELPTASLAGQTDCRSCTIPTAYMGNEAGQLEMSAQGTSNGTNGGSTVQDEGGSN